MNYVRLLTTLTIACALTPSAAIFAQKKESRNICSGIAKLCVGAGLLSLSVNESITEKYLYVYPPGSDARFLPAIAFTAAMLAGVGLLCSGLENIVGYECDTDSTTGKYNVYIGSQAPTQNYTVYVPAYMQPEVYIDYPEVIIL